MFVNCWTFLLVVIGLGERVEFERLVDRSAMLVIGATEEDVLRVLGEPDIQWNARRGAARFLFGKRPAQWIYGTTVDLKAIIISQLPFLNPFPIKIRLFVPDEEDLVIDWTTDKTVSAINRPEVDVPDDVAKFYERVFSIADLVRAFASQPGD